MMNHASAVLLVGAGGFLGSAARYLVALAFAPAVPAFPYATLLVNLAGCFLVGFLSELAVATASLSPDARLFLVTGFCGGFTTFSSYLYEHSMLMKDGQLLYAAFYLAGSVAGGLVALYFGTLLAKLWS